MTQTVLKHIVKQGERWDNLAYHYYGNALEYSRIIDANPHLSFTKSYQQEQQYLFPCCK